MEKMLSVGYHAAANFPESLQDVHDLIRGKGRFFVYALKLKVFRAQRSGNFFFQTFHVKYIARPDPDPQTFIGITGTDTAHRGTYFLVPGFFHCLIKRLMEGKYEMSCVGYKEPFADIVYFAFQPFQLSHQLDRVNDNAVTDHAYLIPVENSRGNQVKNIFFIVHDYW